MSPTTQSFTDLFDTAHREATACFERKDVDVSVTRDTEMDDDSRYVARVVHNQTLAIAHGACPEEALEALIRRVCVIAWRKKTEAKVDGEIAAKRLEIEAEAKRYADAVLRGERDVRATMPTLSPEERDNAGASR